MKYVNYESFVEDDDRYLSDAQNKWAAFDEAKEKLPERLVSLYNQSELFDGMRIYSYKVSRNPDCKHSCARIEVGRGNNSERYVFRYCNIDKFSMDFAANKKNDKSGYMNECLLDEIYLDGKYICHNIMFTDGKEINIRCQSIDVEPKKQ